MSAREISDSRLMSFAEAGEVLGGIHANTIRERKAGTHELTHVSGFGRRVFLIRAEVLALVDKRIAQAQAEERSRRKNLRMVS